MFLPTTPQEVERLGWDPLEVILVTGDSYIDSPFIGTAVIGKLLAKAGYRVGVIAQPDISSVDDIGRLGEPRLFRYHVLPLHPHSPEGLARLPPSEPTRNTFITIA